jgi:transcriptional regulator with XRE-family HTH domain
MGRPVTRVFGYETGYRGARLRIDSHFHEWAMIVGDRIRRLRKERGWTLYDAAMRIPRPDGGTYTPGYIGKLERGVAYAPLYVYLMIAEVYEVHPGRLLGPDDVFNETTEAEMTLIRVVREAGIEPSDAILRVLRPSPG